MRFVVTPPLRWLPLGVLAAGALLVVVSIDQRSSVFVLLGSYFLVSAPLQVALRSAWSRHPRRVAWLGWAYASLSLATCCC